jgi:hypothetical protein
MTDKRQMPDRDAALMQAAMEWLCAILEFQRPSISAAAAEIAPVPATTLALPATSGEQAAAPPANVSWLRSLLLSGSQPAPTAIPIAPSIPVIVPMAVQGDAAEQKVREARMALVAALAADPPPRFTRLCAQADLDGFERDLLLLCLGHALNTRVARLCAQHPEGAAGSPTFALALSLASDERWDRLSADEREQTQRMASESSWNALVPERPLRAWQMIEISQPGAQPLITSPLRIDERIVNHLKGIDYLDDRIAPLCRPLPYLPDRHRFSERQEALLDSALGELAARWRERIDDRIVVQLPGGDSATKQLFARRIAHEKGLALFHLRVDRLAQQGSPEQVGRLWERERRLQPIALYLDASDSSEETPALVGRLLDRISGLVFLDQPETQGGYEPAVLLDTARPAPAEQRLDWAQRLGDDGGDWPERLAAQFSLNVPDLLDVVAAAQALAPEEDAVGARVWALCRGRARPQLDGLAQRIVTRVALRDVQLPPEETRALEQVRDQARHRVTVYDTYGFREHVGRGLGIAALFAGASGTGKTMAAEAIASELQLDLYRIDLATTVSKYIGETEKNLRRIFDAAEQSGAVLLFDEAEALFGKRSEVRDSHDRYSNIEVAYLLQRMEAYEGLAILTTNMKSAIDEAFLRRLRFIVTFPFPGAAERERIWRGVFPAGVRGRDRLDYARLAQPSLTGGQIRNIALNAAFLAAADDGMVTMERLRAAARDELRKAGKPFVVADYARWETPKQPEPALEEV